MEKNYAPSGSERPLSERPLSEGVASASANAPAHESVNVPARESRATNGVDIANTSRGEMPVQAVGEYNGRGSGSNLFLLVTFGLAVIGWFVTLVSQAVVAATISNDAVRILWFGFIIQTYVNFRMVGVLVGVISAYDYGIQISVLTALATAYAVVGVDRNIYSRAAAQQATGAGWLIVAIVDLLWILFFTSPPQSSFVRLLNPSGGPTPSRPNPVTKISRSTDAFAMGALHGGSARASQGASAILDQQPITASGRWSGTGGRRTVGSIPGTEHDGKDDAVVSGSPPSAHLDNAAHANPDQRTSKAVSSLPDDAAKWRAEAIFDYGGSDKDVNELAFKKGEILLIFDMSSKWWEAKTSKGKKGIAPSNYLRLLPEGP